MNLIEKCYELSNTEYRVAEFVAKGFSEKEIADKMFISPHTVHNHTYRIRSLYRFSFCMPSSIRV